MTKELGETKQLWCWCDTSSSTLCSFSEVILEQQAVSTQPLFWCLLGGKIDFAFSNQKRDDGSVFPVIAASAVIDELRAEIRLARKNAHLFMAFDLKTAVVKVS